MLEKELVRHRKRSPHALSRHVGEAAARRWAHWVTPRGALQVKLPLVTREERSALELEKTELRHIFAVPSTSTWRATCGGAWALVTLGAMAPGRTRRSWPSTVGSPGWRRQRRPRATPSTGRSSSRPRRWPRSRLWSATAANHPLIWPPTRAPPRGRSAGRAAWCPTRTPTSSAPCVGWASTTPSTRRRSQVPRRVQGRETEWLRRDALRVGRLAPGVVGWRRARGERRLCRRRRCEIRRRLDARHAVSGGMNE